MEHAPLVGVVMGSKSDYEVLNAAVDLLKEFSIPYEVRVVSAHRTPDWLFTYAEQAESRGLRVIIAGAGGAAHLPGMLAAKTLVPVLGVPVPATMLNGIDSLLSIVQMPKGVPVGTLAIGKPERPMPRSSRLKFLLQPTRACVSGCARGAIRARKKCLLRNCHSERYSSRSNDRNSRRRTAWPHDGYGCAIARLSYSGDGS